MTSSDVITKYEFGIKVAEVFNLDETLTVPTESPDNKDLSLNTIKLAKALGTAIQTQNEGLLLARMAQP